MTLRFVANVDNADFNKATIDLDAAERCSSSHPRPSPRWRLTNATTARAWLVGKLGSDTAVAQ
jgi:hypothetical protein